MRGIHFSLIFHFFGSFFGKGMRRRGNHAITCCASFGWEARLETSWKVLGVEALASDWLLRTELNGQCRQATAPTNFHDFLFNLKCHSNTYVWNSNFSTNCCCRFSFKLSNRMFDRIHFLWISEFLSNFFFNPLRSIAHFLFQIISSLEWFFTVEFFSWTAPNFVELF